MLLAINHASAQGAAIDAPSVATGRVDPGAFILQDTALLARLADGAMRKLRFATAPKSLPDVELRDRDGGAARLAVWHGRFVLLNVWASWCAPCREEMPALARLIERLAKEGATDIAVVTLSIDKTPAAAQDFLTQLGLATLPLYFDPNMQVIKALEVSGAPTSLLIDPLGREIARSEGPIHWSSDEALLLLKALTMKWQAASPPSVR